MTALLPEPAAATFFSNRSSTNGPFLSDRLISVSCLRYGDVHCSRGCCWGAGFLRPLPPPPRGFLFPCASQCRCPPPPHQGGDGLVSLPPHPRPAPNRFCADKRKSTLLTSSHMS